MYIASMDLLEISNTLNDKETKKKHTVKKTNKSQSQISHELINITSYKNKNIDFSVYKLPQLKQLAKKYKLHVTGTKPIIIGRLDKYFRDSIMAIKIQKITRGYMVRIFFKLKGPGFKDKKLCNNDTDFITLEPLKEIPLPLFFSYSDKNYFTYGINVFSIVQSLRNSVKLNNPYNREKMDETTLINALSVYRMAIILFPELKAEYEKFQPTTNIATRTTRQTHQNIINTATQTTYQPVLNAHYMNGNTNERNRFNGIQEKRNCSIPQRINNLFTEMDRLGNYTQISWFTNLDRAELIRLYRSIYDIWYYRGQLNYTIRHNISPFHEPFNSVFNGPVSHANVTYDQIKLAALTVMETLVYCGIDEEYRKIGTFHVLTGLTLVSRPARDAMPWLFESVI